jgi:hypothetical protein
LIEFGHEVRLGSRVATNEDALAWASESGPNATAGSFAVVPICSQNWV